jgi:hypothetical protein
MRNKAAPQAFSLQLEYLVVAQLFWGMIKHSLRILLLDKYQNFDVQKLQPNKTR